MKVLLNAYLVFCFMIFGSEAVAKKLPMKKVQTVETVWVPMEEAEVEETEQVIEAVEIPEGQQEGAIPLFKEGVEETADQGQWVSVEEATAASGEQQLPNGWQSQQGVVTKEAPGVQVNTPPGGNPPVIQVIYQGTPSKKLPAPVVKPKPKPVVVQPKPVPKKVVPKKKTKGDTYNFYFRS